MPDSARSSQRKPVHPPLRALRTGLLAGLLAGLFAVLVAGCGPAVIAPPADGPGGRDAASAPAPGPDVANLLYPGGTLVTPLGRARRPLTIQGRLPDRAADRQAQILDTTPIAVAAIRVSGSDLPVAIVATASVSNGRVAPVTLDLPEGANRVVEVRGLNEWGAPASPFSVVRAVVSIPEAATLSVDPVTTPAGDVVLALRAAGSPLELTLDTKALGRFVNRIVFGTTDGSRSQTMVTHPGLIDTTALAQAIGAAGSLPGATAGFARAPARLSGQIAGLLLGQVARVTVDDPFSEAVTTDASGNYAIPAVLPGATLGVTVSSEFYAATSSIVAPIGPGGQGSANLTLTGNFMKASLFAQACDLTNVTARFTQLPIRILTILPGDARAASLGWNSWHTEAVADSLAAYEASFPGVLKFESTALKDNDPALETALRRSDIYLYWVDDGSKTWCGGKAIGCESPYQPGGLMPCETGASVVNRSYQAGVQIAVNYNEGGGPLPRRVVWAVTEHEIGHALGMNHSSDPLDVMYPTVAFFGNNLTLARGDLNTIRFLYSLPANLTRDHAAYDLVPTYQNDGRFTYPTGPLAASAQAFLNR